MAQAGYTPISLYYSTTASAVPVNTNLVNGELAINITDGKLYYKDNTGTVKVIAGAGGTGIVAGSNTQIQFNNNGVFGASANLTWNGTTLSTTQINITAQGDLRLEDTTGGEYVALQAPGTLASSYTLTLPVDDGTNGQALITDGSGNLSWSTAASGDVYGPASATDNAITRFDGTTGKLIQNSSALVDDAGNVLAGAGLVGAPAFSTTGDTNTGIYFPAADTIGFVEGGAEAMRITSNGDVGIGTTTPVSRLHVGASGADSVITNERVSGAIVKQYAAASAGSIGTETNHSFQFFTNNITRATIDTSGNVGIGTSSPSVRLHVVGGNNAQRSLRLDSNGSGYVDFYQAGGSGAIFDTVGTSGQLTYLFQQNSATRMTLDSSGNLGLGVTPSAWTTITPLQIKNSAFVGYTTGTTHIAYVGANWFNSSGDKYIANGAAGLYTVSNNTHNWYIAPSGTAGNPISFTQAMTLDANGNLGVGTTSPVNNGRTLTIYNSAAAGTAWLYSQNGNSGQTLTDGMGLGLSGSDGYIWNYEAGAILLGTSGTERMRITSTGNVGIGTSNPFADSGYNSVDIRGSTGGQINLGTTSTRIGQLSVDATNGITLNTVTATPIRFFVQGAERVRIDTSGNLGLGVTPSAWGSSYRAMQIGQGGALQAGNGTFPSFVGLSANAFVNATPAAVYINNSAATIYQQNGGQHQWFIAPAGTAGNTITFTQAMTLDTSGNLGVGTTGAISRLDVRGTSSDTDFTDNNFVTSGPVFSTVFNESLTDGSFSALSLVARNASSTGQSAVILAQSTSSGFAPNIIFGQRSAAGSGTTERMRITATGNVGVGTTTPGSLLTVAAADTNNIVGGSTAAINITNTNETAYGRTTNIIFSSGAATETANKIAAIGSVYTSFNTSRAGALTFSTSNDTGTFAERMRIDSSGNVGIGTSSPSFAAGTGLQVKSATDSNVRITGGGTSTGFDLIQVNNSTAYVWNRDNAPILFGTNNAERMRIDSGGALLVGATSQHTSELFNVTSSSSSNNRRTVNIYNSAATSTTRTANELLRYSSNGSGADVCINFTDNVSKNYWFGGNNGGAYVVAVTNGVRLAENGTSWASDSDERIKDIIEPITDAANKVSKLRSVIGKYKTDKEDKRRPFLIAQDVQAVLPEAVFDEQGILMLAYTDTIPLLVAAIKEQQAMIEELKQEVAKLKGV